MCKFSIIIPVYNTEKYLRECLDSVKSQTFPDFEVLLIDDGSTDLSGKICDDYAKNDERFIVYHKVNGGVSEARNFALDKIRGEYVKFVDGDDLLDKDCLQELAEYIEQYKWDVIEHSWYTFFDDGKREFENWFEADYTVKKGENKSYLYRLLFDSYRMGSMCKKAVKADFFNGTKAKIRFDKEMVFAEDQMVAVEIFDKCESVKFINEPYYGYRKGLQSATGKFNIKKKDNIKMLLKYLDSLWGKIYHDKDAINSYNARKLDNIVSDIGYLPAYKNVGKKEKKDYISSYVNDDYFYKVLNENIRNLSKKKALLKYLLKKKAVNAVYMLLCVQNKLK